MMLSGRALNVKGKIIKIKSCLFAAFLFWTLCSGVTYADTWAPPVERDYFSDDKNYVAHVTPAKGETKAGVEVFEIEDSERVPVWRCELGNEGAPAHVFLSNDGAHVVTVNEVSGRVHGGMGDYVLAFYNKDGVIKHYSLEQLLHYPEKIDKRAFRKLVRRSVSGRGWAARPMFFDRTEGELRFCIWLIYGHRWLVWQVTSGQEVKVNDETTDRLNEMGRKWARREGVKSKYWSLALQFLGHCKRAEDREIIESFLCAGEFRTNSMNLYSSSVKRSRAERILAEWDDRSPDVYGYLGIVEGTVKLVRPPKMGDGWLCVYLVPQEIDQKDWYLEVPVHRFCLYFGKYSFSDDRWPSETIPFKIKGVTPGEYRIKTVWDVAEPHSFGDDYIKDPPQEGDYHNLTSTEINVGPGETIVDTKIICTNEVKPVSIKKSGKYESWIKTLVKRYPVALGKDETVFDWWPLKDGMEYEYKITHSRWDSGKKNVNKQFILRLIQDREDLNKFHFRADGFDEFHYKGLLIRENRIFILSEHAKEPLIIFPLFKDILFADEKYEYEFLKTTVMNTSEELFYGPVASDFWTVNEIDGTIYSLRQTYPRGTSYKFKKGVGIVEWYIPGGYTIELSTI